MITSQKIADALTYLGVINSPQELHQIVSVQIMSDEVIVSRVSEVTYEVGDDEDADQPEPEPEPREGLRRRPAPDETLQDFAARVQSTAVTDFGYQ